MSRWPYLVLAVLAVVSSACRAAPQPSSADPRLAGLAQQLGVEIAIATESFYTRTPYGRAVEGRACAAPALTAAIPIVLHEFELYPPALIRRMQLRQLVLCQDLAFGRQKRAAVPYFEARTFYLDVGFAVKGSAGYLARVIHHDFFHLIDECTDTLLYQDAAWAELNAAEFNYGFGGALAQNDPRQGMLDDQLAGFLTPYAMTGIEEDKAEVFTFLILRPEYVEKRMTTDLLLARKVALLKQQLRSYVPELGDAFWQRAAAAAPTRGNARR